MNQDLRGFISFLRESGQIRDIKSPVKREYEISALMMRLQKEGLYPSCYFSNVEGSAFPVITNLLAPRKRLADALGTDVSSLASVYALRSQNRIEPTSKDNPPFLENSMEGGDVDLSLLPILRHFPIDSGPFITSGMCVVRDPLTGAETIGLHRLELKGKNKLGISLHSRQRLWEYFRRSEEASQDMEAAIAIGVHPVIALGSMALVPYHLGKFAAIGGLFEESMLTANVPGTLLEVPYFSEFVIKGKILSGVREKEGPFAEFTNYASYRSTENVFTVEAIYHRNGAVYHSITPAMSAEHITIVAVQREGDVLAALKRTQSGIVGVHAPVSSCGLFHCYISIKKTAEGQPLQAAMAALSIDHHIKHVIVVDDDVDVYSEEEVLWAIATRLQADKGVVILPQAIGMGETLDPSTDEQSRSSKMIIDATKPLSGFPEKVAMHEGTSIDRLWAEAAGN